MAASHGFTHREGAWGLLPSNITSWDLPVQYFSPSSYQPSPHSVLGKVRSTWGGALGLFPSCPEAICSSLAWHVLQVSGSHHTSHLVKRCGACWPATLPEPTDLSLSHPLLLLCSDPGRYLSLQEESQGTLLSMPTCSGTSAPCCGHTSQGMQKK